MRAIILVVVSIAMAGCVTAEQRKEREEKAAQERMAAWMNNVKTLWGPQCETLGFQWGTDQWRGCVMEFFKDYQNQQIAQERRDEANRQHWGNAMRDFGNKVYGPAATQARQIPVPQTPIFENRAPAQIHCQTDGPYTNCYGN